MVFKLWLMAKRSTIYGVRGLEPIGRDCFKVVDPKLAVKYLSILEDEPGVFVTKSRLEVHVSHLPLLPGWSGCAPTHTSTPAPPFPLSQEWWDELRPEQQEAVAIIRSRCGTVLGDDLGAGKSRIALGAADYPAVVFCPKSAIIVWEDEATYAGLRYRVLSGRVANVEVFKEDVDLWILPWSVAGSWAGFFSSVGMGPNVKTKIGDEIHEIQKNVTSSAKSWKLVDCDQTIELTATMIRNRLRSLWSVLDGAQTKAWGSQYDFRKRYCAATEGDYGLEDGEPTDESMDRLRRRLEACVIKRTREELGLVIPPLDREVIEVEMSNSEKLILRQEAHTAVTDSRFWAQGTTGGVQLAWATELRQRLGMIKARAAVPVIAERLNEWRRAVVWVWHNDVAEYLAERLVRDVRCHVSQVIGSTLDKTRKRVLREWKLGDIDPKVPEVLIASIGACSSAVAFLTTGLMIFVEQDWAPLQMVQAEKRIHRPYQRHDQCLAIYLTTGEGTLDHEITKTLVEKANETEALLGPDGQADQMRTILGIDIQESDRDFMARVAERLTR